MDYQFIVLLHVLGFVYWLGADAGVFYASNFIIKRDLSNESRMTAAKIMMTLDLIPRICMTLMLTLGGTLVWYQGLHEASPIGHLYLPALWLLAPFWLGLVLFLHFREGTDGARTVTKIDFYLRWFLVVTIIASQVYAYRTGMLESLPWLQIKIVVFAFLIFCGLMIRINILPFVHGLHQLASGHQMTDDDNAALELSLRGARPWVLAIWAGVFLEGALGILKPLNEYAWKVF